MVLTQTPLCEFGLPAKPFKNLRGVDGATYSLADIQGKTGTLIIFMCNHCPYVQAIIAPLVEDVKKLQALGIGVIAINANDAKKYPDDSFTNMQVFARQHGLTFPYVIDETQQVAKAYGAVCTPDFFGYNASLQLQYRGRFMELRNLIPVAGAKHELLDAMTQVATQGTAPRVQNPSMGCSIKWINEAA